MTKSYSTSPLRIQLTLLQVDLPRSEYTMVKVSPSISMAQLLIYICEKRNIDHTQHRFYLPGTEDSLTDKSLQELKITRIMVVPKGRHGSHDDGYCDM